MKKLIIAALALGLCLAPGPTAAAPEPGGYDKIGVVVTGVDGRFSDAVTVMVHPDTNINRPGPDGKDVPHIHFYRDGIPAGGLQTFVGRAFIVEVYGHEDALGKHWYVVAGKMEETSPQAALDVSGVEEQQGYPPTYEQLKKLREN